MTGRELQIFAMDNGLQMEYGRAYGFLRGYCVTMWEEAGKLVFVVATRFCEKDEWKSLAKKLKTPSAEKKYRIHSIDVREDRIRVRLKGKLGKDIKLLSFMDWFFPLLEQHGACGQDVCPHCGRALTEGQWKLIKGIAVYVHEACGRELRSKMQQDLQKHKDSGSYRKGALGAALGALAGALIWALITMLGYKAYIVGFLTVLLADRGYVFLKGKENRGKILILALAVLLGIVIGDVLGNVLIIIRDFRSYDLPITFSDSWKMLYGSIAGNMGSRRTLTFEILIGLVFAAVGAVSLFLREKSEYMIPNYADLEQEAQPKKKTSPLQVHQ